MKQLDDVKFNKYDKVYLKASHINDIGLAPDTAYTVFDMRYINHEVYITFDNQVAPAEICYWYPQRMFEKR